MKKKLLVVFFALVFVLSLATACSGDKTSADTKTDSNPAQKENGEQTAQEEEPYEVNFLYLVAFEGADQQEVSDAITELALKELNMTVNLIPMTIGTYESQLPVMMASNEPLDLAPVLARNFASFVESQYILNMNEYLEYAPDMLEILGEDATCTQIGDFLIGVPNMKERAMPSGLVARKDIFDELGYNVEDFDISTDDYSSFDQITQLYADVKVKYPNMDCLDGSYIMGTQTDTYIDKLGSDFAVLENYGQTTTVTNWFESEQYLNFCNIAREWYQAGYSSADIAINTDTGETKMKAGNCFSFVSIIKPNTAQEKQSQTGYEVVVIPISETMKATSTVGIQVYCLANASENPAKAMEFLNWTFVSSEFENLLNWGIEGKHWVETEDGLATFPDGVDITNVGYHNDFGWGYPNQFAGNPWVGNPADIWDQYMEYNTGDSMIKSQGMGFMFDPRPVADQIAQLNGVFDQYKKDLAFGVVEIEPILAGFNEALYDAGLQTVIDEKQAQLDAWLESKE